MIRILSVLAGSAVLACAAAVEDAPVVEPEEVAPVIATLELRDRRLTVASTSSGVRYDVTDAGGTRAHLTIEQLEAVAPELAELVRSASARSALDASVGIGWAGRAPR